MEDTCFNIHSLALNMYIKPQFCARTLIGVSLRDLQGAYTERLFEVTSYVFLQKPEQLILLRKWIVLATAGGVYKYPLAAGIRQSGWFGWQKGSLGGGRKKWSTSRFTFSQVPPAVEGGCILKLKIVWEWDRNSSTCLHLQAHNLSSGNSGAWRQARVPLGTAEEQAGPSHCFNYPGPCIPWVSSSPSSPSQMGVSMYTGQKSGVNLLSDLDRTFIFL